MKSEKRDLRLYFEDIIEAIILIEKYLGGVTEEQFHASQEKQDSVVRRIEIIGEATKNISDKIRNKYPEIPWKKMAGMRDVIVHDYFGINYKRVWETAIEFLPPLKRQIKEILERKLL